MTHKTAIIGGGLAGTSCAYFLKQRGYEPVIFEANDHLASGASGNPIGLYNPRFFANKSPEADFYIDAYLGVSKLFKTLGDKIDHSPHGSMHLLTTEDKAKRFSKMIENWGLPDQEMRMVHASEASEITGIDLQHGGLFLANSGAIAPAKLCDIYADGIEVRLNTPIDVITLNDAWYIGEDKFDSVILACGTGIKHFDQAEWLPVHSVRGQISGFEESPTSRNLKTNINYGGYITPSLNGVHTCGSTFQKWLTHTDVLEEDNDYILDKLTTAVPALDDIKTCVDARASLRTASQDRLPIIGRLPIHDLSAKEVKHLPNIYTTVAHGSHGIVTSYMAAMMIVDEICGEPIPKYAECFLAERFLKRLQKAHAG